MEFPEKPKQPQATGPVRRYSESILDLGSLFPYGFSSVLFVFRFMSSPNALAELQNPQVASRSFSPAFVKQPSQKQPLALLFDDDVVHHRYFLLPL
jgi:hypothetical protein